jgi:sporulation protein YunB
MMYKCEVMPLSNRFRTSKRGPLKIKHIVFVILIILTLASLQGFLFVERNLEPALKEIARTQVKQIATLAISDAISKKVAEEIAESDDLIEVKEDKDQRITFISFNQSKQAKIVAAVTDRANQTLIELSKDPIRIPIGQALDSNILAQLGPNVPITLVPMGAAKADIEVRLNEAGINVVSIEVYLIIEADVRIVIPFSSEEAVVTTEFPIDIKIIPGEVPEVYFNGGEDTSIPTPNISIPSRQGD